MSTYDDLVALAERVYYAPPTFITQEDIERWMHPPHVRCHGPRSGVTPGGIEWRSWS